MGHGVSFHVISWIIYRLLYRLYPLELDVTGRVTHLLTPTPGPTTSGLNLVWYWNWLVQCGAPFFFASVINPTSYGYNYPYLLEL